MEGVAREGLPFLIQHRESLSESRLIPVSGHAGCKRREEGPPALQHRAAFCTTWRVQWGQAPTWRVQIPSRAQS